MISPPSALSSVTFTNWAGRTATVRLTLDAYRTYNATMPRGNVREAMVAARYLDAEGVLPTAFCVVYAGRSVGVEKVLNAIARAAIRYALTVLPDPGEEERGEPQKPPCSGISWPLSAAALREAQARNYTGYRLRGAAGFIRPIRPDDYGEASFWVEPNGVEPGQEWEPN